MPVLYAVGPSSRRVAPAAAEWTREPDARAARDLRPARPRFRRRPLPAPSPRPASRRRSRGTRAWASGSTTSHAACNDVLRERRLGPDLAAASSGDDGVDDVQLAARRLDPRQRAAQAHPAAPARRGRLRPRATWHGSAPGRGAGGAAARRCVERDLSRRRPRSTSSATYAEPLPVLVIAELLGWPEADRHLLRAWSQAIVKMYEVEPDGRRAGGGGAHCERRVRGIRRSARRRAGRGTGRRPAHRPGAGA